MNIRFWLQRVQCIALLSLLACKAEGLPLLSIQSDGSQVLSGGDINLAIMISGISDLYSYQFDTTYSPGLLQVQRLEEGTFLPLQGSTIFLPGRIDNNVGMISATAGTLIGQKSGASGKGVLAVLSLRAIGSGSSTLTLSRVTLLDSQLQGISFQTTPTTISITPEPNALTLTLAGMLLIALCKPTFMRSGKRSPL